MRTLLHLHPHKHTGKLLHHRHTSYPALLVVMVLTGLVLLTPVGMARASDYQVTAIVPAPLSTEPPVISKPLNGSGTYQSSVTISGTCPVVDPSLIVVLYEGSSILGSQTCSAAGTFAMTVGFSPGAHTIYAQTYNFTGQTGASSTPVTFQYVLPETVITGTRTTEEEVTVTSPGSAGPLEIISQAPFIVFGVSKDAVWDTTLRGGTPPYVATLHWSDGTVQTISNLQPGKHSFSHHYNVMRSYKVTLDLRDSVGRKASRGITAVTPTTYSAYSTTPTQRPSWLWLLYFIYIVVTFWLLFMWHRHRLLYQPATVSVPAARRHHRRSNTTTRKRR